jgi:SPX domain protein involved in polyphosphate accumulation
MEKNMVFHRKNSQTAIEYLEAKSPNIKPRYERKFRMPIGFELIMANRLMSVGFRKVFPDRSVNSIYFDTNQLDFAQDNINGIANRLKIRKRWYGEYNILKSDPRLEFKHKKGFLGYKYHHRINNYCNKSVVEYVQKTMGMGVSPKLETNYYRSYYMNDNGFRVTLDSRLGTKDCINKSKTASLLYSVMEIKYPIDRDEQYRKHLHMKINSMIPLRLNKSSKYVESLTALHVI